MIVFVCVWDLVKVGEGGGDESEDILVYEVLCCEVGVWLFVCVVEGYLIDLKLFVGLWFLEYVGGGVVC